MCFVYSLIYTLSVKIPMACVVFFLVYKPCKFLRFNKALPQVAGDDLHRQLQGYARTVALVTLGASCARHTSAHAYALGTIMVLGCLDTQVSSRFSMPGEPSVNACCSVLSWQCQSNHLPI